MDLEWGLAASRESDDVRSESRDLRTQLISRRKGGARRRTNLPLGERDELGLGDVVAVSESKDVVERAILRSELKGGLDLDEAGGVDETRVESLDEGRVGNAAVGLEDEVGCVVVRALIREAEVERLRTHLERWSRC